MAIVRKTEAPTFDMPGLHVRGLASPKRGSNETCVWQISLAPKTPGFPHACTREEIFVATAGQASVVLDGVEQDLRPGDALIVPPHTKFSIGNPGDQPFEALVSFPAGGQAITEEGLMTPPWVE
jgi:mannose-6-phosphate isomerase-like protein (cupin superfamily)